MALPPWRGVFYPKKLAQARELEFASCALPSIELNGSFYALQRPASYRAWYEATPPGFVLSHKGNRYLTHLIRLREPREALANIFASGVFELREKLGPFLWQLPPSGGGQPDDAKLISGHKAPQRASRDIYCYFDNDIKVRAPFYARRLIRKLGLDEGLADIGGG